MGYKSFNSSNDYTSVYVKNTLIDFGEINKSELPEAIFKLQNVGGQDLLISKVKAGCNCTVPSWTKNPIKTGEWAEITAKYDNSDFGFFQKNISVYCNTKDSPIVLTIQGKVKFTTDTNSPNVY